MDDVTLTRKGLLSAGALAAGTLVLRSQTARSAPAPVVEAPGSADRVIDVHGHAITSVLESALERRGSRVFDGRALPSWDIPSTLAYLDRQGIDLQVLSTPDPALSLFPADDHVRAARATNDELAAIVAAHPSRFGALAVLPLRAGPGAAIAELRRATRVLGLDGVILPTDVGARSLGDSVYLPLLAELSRRRTPALVHPVSPAAAAWPEQQGSLPDTLEHAFASVRCAAALLYGGAFLRAPNLRLVFAAGGGGLPFVASRVALADQALHRELFILPLRRLSFDLAQSTAPGALDSMAAFVRSPHQLLLGTDWPLAPEQPARASLARLPAGDQRVVAGLSALRLFPTLGGRARLPQSRSVGHAG